MNNKFYIVESGVSIYREDYYTRQEYLRDYHDLRKSHDYRVRVEGGWRFFKFEQDYKTWKNQK